VYIDKLCVTSAYANLGLEARLLRNIPCLGDMEPVQLIQVWSLHQVTPFYTDLGFVPVRDPWGREVVEDWGPLLELRLA
jgi:hypothetical protein